MTQEQIYAEKAAKGRANREALENSQELSPGREVYFVKGADPRYWIERKTTTRAEDRRGHPRWKTTYHLVSNKGTRTEEENPDNLIPTQGNHETSAANDAETPSSIRFLRKKQWDARFGEDQEPGKKATYPEADPGEDKDTWTILSHTWEQDPDEPAYGDWTIWIRNDRTGTITGAHQAELEPAPTRTNPHQPAPTRKEGRTK